MKYFISVLLAAICGSALCGMADGEDNKKQCHEIHNVKPEDVGDAINGKIKEADLTANIKCFFLCLGERQKIFKNGVFQPQVFREGLSSTTDKDYVSKVIAECNVKGTDDCDTGFKVASCMAKQNVKWEPQKAN